MKVLLRGRPDEQELEQRFLREIQVQASLHHPNIATVLNAFWSDDDLVMVMELVEGASLESILRRGRLPLSSALDYTCQALAALSYAHEHGVIHRDITPSNIIVTADGTVKLTDFGLAKCVGAAALTPAGTVMGSLYYLSPEQVRAHRNLDARSDIYSLGAVLYELVTGQKVIEGKNSFALMIAQVEQAPKGLVEIDPGIPAALNEVVLKALAKKPDERFQSAWEFREALERVRRTVAPPVPAAWSRWGSAAWSRWGNAAWRRWGYAARSRWGSAARNRWGSAAWRRWGLQVRRDRAWIALAAGVVLLAAAGAGAWRHVVAAETATVGILMPQIPPPPRPPADWAQTAVPQAQPAPDPSNPQPKPAPRLVARTQSVRLDDVPGPERALPILPLVVPMQQILPPPVVIERKEARPPEPPPGTYRQALVVAASGNVVALAVSPDGRRIAAGAAQGVIELWDASTGARLATLQGHTGAVTALAFSPDGARLASGGMDGTAKVWDLAARIDRSTFGSTSGVRAVAFSADGQWLATGESDGKVKLWSLRARGRVLDLPGKQSLNALAFSPAANFLVAASLDKSLHVWTEAEDRGRNKLGGFEHGAAAVAFSRDGKLLAAGGGDRLKLWDAASRNEILGVGIPGRVLGLAFTADGRCLAFGATPQGLKAWDVSKSAQLVAPEQGNSPQVVGVSADARRVVVAARSGAISVWDGRP